MDSRATEREILELENKLLHPTGQPISVPLGFLRSITSDFCDEQELGRGGYGVVYKGILRCGSVIAVKKFNEIILPGDYPSFENEASFLMDMKHQNVIQLRGYCAESKGVMMKQPNGKVIVAEAQTRMLCFEYMCNGGLDKHVSGESSGLEWNTRYKIIKGICSGLKYLHECNIIHLDLKPQNILMDTTMMPKIADFGLSRLLGEQKSQTVTETSNPPGTRGYMAPEYIDLGIISKKADIFSLGVIIIEILKGCKDYPDYGRSTEDYGRSTEVFQHFTEKVLSNWRNRFERPSKYTSPELHTQLVKQCIDIALECVHPDKEKRPNVSNIIEILNAAEESCYGQNGEDLPVDHQVFTNFLSHPANMQYILLKDVTPESVQHTVKVRTVRFCEYLNNETPRVPMRMDLVLLDDQGRSMEAQILKAWIPTFKQQLKEDSVYYIKYFQVLNARASFRPADHPYMIRFTAHTKVTEVTPVPDTFPLYACTPISFSALHQKARNPDYTYTSDVLGILKWCSHIKMQPTAKGVKPLRNVYITDGNQHVDVALWDQQAEAFEAEKYMSMAEKQPVVLLFVAVTARLYQDNLSLQGSTLCRFYVNPQLPQAIALQNSAGGCLPPPTWHAPKEITVTELAKFDNPHIIYSKKYIVTARIKSMVPDESWWYLACDVPSCRRTTKQTGDTYKCTSPKCCGTSGGPRYRLALLATDPGQGSDEAQGPAVQLVFFGPRAEEIIGSPVEALISDGAGFGQFVPTHIASLYGKYFNLQISVSSLSLQSTDISYQVDAILGVANISLHIPAPAPSEPATTTATTDVQQTSSSPGQHTDTVLQETITPLATPMKEQTLPVKRSAHQVDEHACDDTIIHEDQDGPPPTKRRLQFSPEEQKSGDT